MIALPPELLGLRGGAVESWFSKANAPDGTRALWTRCTVFARKDLPPVAEAWAIAFDRHRGHVAVKSTVPFESARFATDAVDAEVDGCTVRAAGTRGALASGRGALTWDLAFGPALVDPIVHLPALWMYRDAVPPFSKLVTPVADARARGEVVVDRGGGDRDVWAVDEWPVMVGHNWGRGNAELYAWTHCNAWEIDKQPAPGLVLEAFSARVRVGPLLSPMATAAFLRWRGKSWDLSSPRALSKNRGTISLRRWELTTTEELELACDVAAETDDVVGLHYANPNGSMTYCLNTKLARARLDVRFPDGEALTATSRAAALEIGTLDAAHGVRMVL
ncbi:MAG: hypothetical protein KIT84_27825 [Labilithrix sp.]|nr:hypothetical protein [Labilithrix sp.]MCW5814869.1 hypothetical protein [Labilithrix sp.]